MSEYRPPVLGFDCVADIARVEWQDGTVVCGGILGDMSPETLAQERAERERKEELRQQGIVVLDDHRHDV